MPFIWHLFALPRSAQNPSINLIIRNLWYNSRFPIAPLPHCAVLPFAPPPPGAPIASPLTLASPLPLPLAVLPPRTRRLPPASRRARAAHPSPPIAHPPPPPPAAHPPRTRRLTPRTAFTRSGLRIIPRPACLVRLRSSASALVALSELPHAPFSV
ncbi:hypothetical protein B0H11DRAFT_2247754 [Mycena galericulata]|nr:hypothetical protein B0H11DRAFT_2247754 [Mycena galericulata]